MKNCPKYLKNLTLDLKYERETADDNINASSAPALKFTLQLCQPTPGHLKLMTDLQHLFSIIYNLLQFTMTIFYFSFSIASQSQACHRCVTFKDFYPSIQPNPIHLGLSVQKHSMVIWNRPRQTLWWKWIKWVLRLENENGNLSFEIHNLSSNQLLLVTVLQQERWRKLASLQLWNIIFFLEKEYASMSHPP